MSDVTPPVPDPKREPKPAAEMGREGEHEGEVLVERDHSQSAPADDGETISPTQPIVPLNGD